MGKIQIYAMLAAFMFFLGHIANYTPKLEQSPSLDPSFDKPVISYQSVLPSPEPEVTPEPVPEAPKHYEQLSPHELKDLLYSVGFRGEALRQAWGTAMKESTGRPMAHNQNSKTGDNSYGLFQINMIGNLGPDRLQRYGLSSNEDLFNPLVNAQIAFTMSGGGSNWSPWNGITENTIKWMNQYPN
jgi:hypothetical protein